MLKSIIFLILTGISSCTSAMIQHKIQEEIPIFLHIKSIKSSIDDKTAFNIASTIVKASNFHNVDPNLVTAVIQNESMFSKNAVSRMGAVGYMQIMEKWHKSTIKKYFKKFQSNSLFNLKVNIWTGTEILAKYIQRYGTVKRGLQAYHGALDNRYYKQIMRNMPKLDNIIIYVPNQNLYITKDYIFVKDDANIGIYQI